MALSLQHAALSLRWAAALLCVGKAYCAKQQHSQVAV
jgi:hypothetical protein